MTDYVSGAVGGVLLGGAAVFLLLALGYPVGISGFLSKALSFKGKVAGWRLSFLGGMLVVSLLLGIFYPEPIAEALPGSIGLALLAAFLVGAGARVAGGCTSGHSLCGMGRLDYDSIIATVIFILSGAATVYLVFGGPLQ